MKRVATAVAGFGLEELPELDPIVVAENTATGWRGLTELGEVLTVNGDPEHPPSVIEGGSVTMMRGSEIQGTRMIRAITPGAIDRYLAHYNRGIELHKANEFEQAGNEFFHACANANTVLARWNYGLVLLAMGDWERGLDWYEARHKFRKTPSSGAPRWTGGDLTDRLMLIEHELGFGDTIMLLRYVPILRARFGGIFLNMPPALARLAKQLAPVTRFASGVDLSLPIMSLLERLKVQPQNVPQAPYLQVEAELVGRWRTRLEAAKSKRPRIGLAWSVGNVYPDDYPRSIPLEPLVNRLRKIRGGNVELYSVQAQNGDEAERLGVRAMPFEDFADCAALMSMMDQIYTVDTAALHLAGAIGHERVIGLLSWWHSWRWKACWYPNVQMIVQDRADDWPSALAKLL